MHGQSARLDLAFSVSLSRLTNYKLCLMCFTYWLSKGSEITFQKLDERRSSLMMRGTYMISLNDHSERKEGMYDSYTILYNVIVS